MLDSLWFWNEKTNGQLSDRPRMQVHNFISDEKKTLILNHFGLGKTDVRLSFSTHLCSITTISNTGALKWIADFIDCTDDNSFSVEKIKLHWFDLKKFISKKKSWLLQLRDIKERQWSMQSGKFCKIFDQFRPLTKYMVVVIPKFFYSFMNSHNKTMIKQGKMCSTLFRNCIKNYSKCIFPSQQKLPRGFSPPH